MYRLRYETLECRRLLTSVPLSASVQISSIPTPKLGDRLWLDDIDLDGDLDIAILDLGENTDSDLVEHAVLWSANTDGKGNYAPPAPLFRLSVLDRFNPFDLADIDGDGDNDFYFIDQRRLSWVENLGGVFAAAELVFPVEANILFDGFPNLVDFDGQGGIDIITSDSSIYENPGGGVAPISHPRLRPLVGSSQIVADLDSDGDNDVVTYANDSDSVVWFRNNDNFEFERRSSNRLIDDKWGIQITGAVDLDADGDTDLIGNSPLELLWFENDGEQNFTHHQVFVDPFGDEVGPSFSLDIDLDGDIDILSPTFGGQLNLINSGAGEFTLGDPNEIRWHFGSMQVGDIDSDGDVDRAILGSDKRRLTWQENTGGIAGLVDHSVANPTVVESDFNGQLSVLATDIDSDGDLDLLGHALLGRASWYPNDGEGVFSDLKKFRSPLNIDLNGDGAFDHVDVATNFPRDGEGLVMWRRNEQGELLALQNVRIDGPLPQKRVSTYSSRDLDGDGDVDLWLRPISSEDTYLLINDESGGFQSTLSKSFLPFLTSRHSQFSDINHDGLVDAVFVGGRNGLGSEDDLFWSEQEPGFSFDRDEYQHIAEDIAYFAVADLNADAFPDVVTTKYSGGRVRVDWHINDNGTLSEPVGFELGPRGQFNASFHLTDLNNDGLLELITSDKINGLSYHVLNTQTANAIVPIQVDAEITGQVNSVTTGDFNDDGSDDLVITSGFHVRLYENQSAQDLNQDGVVSAADIDALSIAIRENNQPKEFDLNQDETVDALDRQHLIEVTLQTRAGDADLDGAVSFADFLIMSANFGSEGSWSSGDFSGDGQISFDDFLLLSENFGFED